MIEVVLAEDHLVVRQGLHALLAKEEDISIVAQAADGLEALELVRKLEPDVLVLDLMLPQLSGLEVTRRIASEGLKTKVTVLSMHADEGYVLQALRHGARAYVLKESSAADLVRAIHTCVQGNRYLSPPLSEGLLNDYRAKVETGKLSPYKTLTNREREVLELVAGGLPGEQVAKRLSISPRTVETHRANIMRKLNLNSMEDLTQFAREKGLLSSS